MRTNICTNPSMETTGGWQKGGTAAHVTFPSNEQANNRSNSMKLAQNNGSCYAYMDLTVTPGATYRFSAYIKVTAQTQGGVWLKIIKPDGSATYASGGNTSAVGDWVRVNISGTIAVGVTTARFMIDGYDNVIGTFYIDSVLIEESASLGNYFDGATTDTVDFDYAWTGATDASTSTETEAVAEDPVMSPFMAMLA